ncbi:hypothetical protein [Pseudobacteriovorax antillogorgiicola]|uniref:Uncharacterized protein n=1 Tax=Pseudobacteriovorax antillogorgiicola TaxID=1513793 RepID=A0A1Y6BKP3_9BACT|nr:hypothetical protein [Pseudobacteriovorax antillogorgiicola]TCS54685.1 hypothetical protein EDD56_106198 [Pseudobacteriovorax antillogorgiicola]SMF16538.1 hypothetical protein SAMN06296036_10645 [Pseudobacteriovorax antillogorgiicola]
MIKGTLIIGAVVMIGLSTYTISDSNKLNSQQFSHLELQTSEAIQAWNELTDEQKKSSFNNKVAWTPTLAAVTEVLATGLGALTEAAVAKGMGVRDGHVETHPQSTCRSIMREDRFLQAELIPDQDFDFN